MSDKLKLFKYAVILHKKETKDGVTSYIGADLLVPPTDILAKTDREVAMRAAKKVPDDVIENKSEDVEILIRPF